MKAKIEIEFVKINNTLVNDELIKKESNLKNSALIFIQRLGNALKKDFFKPKQVIISDPIYEILNENNKLYGIIHFRVEKVARKNIKEIENETIRKLFKKDLDFILGEIEEHVAIDNIDLELKGEVENG